MSIAVLCPSGHRLGTADAARLAAELDAALVAAGATTVHRLLPPDARGGGGVEAAAALRDIVRIARMAGRGLLICADNLVIHPSLLAILATEPAGRTTALVSAGDGDLREVRGRLVPGSAAGTAVRFTGALAIAAGDVPAVAEAAERLAARMRPGAPKRQAGLKTERQAGSGAERQAGSEAERQAGSEAERQAGSEAERQAGGAEATGRGLSAAKRRAGQDVAEMMLSAVFEAGVVPVATRVRLLRAERVATAAQLSVARDAIAAVDEEAARLRLAVKEQDDFFTTYAVSTWSPRLTRWCARLRLTPAGVTAVSVLLAGAAAAAFWQASRPAMIAGAVALYLGFVLDCVDGQLARYTRRFVPSGAWLDTMADRFKEYLVYAGLAAGADAWPLAIAAIVLQTVRHMTDHWYGVLHDRAAERPPAAPGGTGLGDRLGAASDRVRGDVGSATYWLKRIVVLPIGERWALVALAAALFDGRVALAVLVGWGLCALAYTLGLRSVRAASMRVVVLDRAETSRHRDDGPLAREVLGAARAGAPLLFALIAVASVGLLVLAVATGWPTLAPERNRLADVAVPLVSVMALVLTAGVSARSRHDGPLDWLVPAALRAAEYLVVVAVGLIGEVPPEVVYLLLFVLAMHHYDRIAGPGGAGPGGAGPGGAGPGGAGPARLGWDGRIVVLVGTGLLALASFGMAVLALGTAAGMVTDRAWGGPR